MCNARNHPPGCNCGWGQGWQSGGYGSSSGRSSFSFRELNSSRLSSSRSFLSTPVPVISTSLKNMNANVLRGTWSAPNSICPMCRQGVYFYKLEHGGKVYFDELGPPWPKHVCTDSLKNIKTTYSGEDRWDRVGWQPLQNFTVTITGRDEGFLVRMHGEDVNQKERRFFFRIADDVEFDICRFSSCEEFTKLSILAHNKTGDFLIYEGLSSPGKFHDLKIKSSSEIDFIEKPPFNVPDFFKFFNEWASKKPWNAILKIQINLISGNLYKINGCVDGVEAIFQFRMEEFYFVRYARFQTFGVSSAMVSLLVEKSEDPDNFYVLEGAGAIGKSFPPGKKLEIKEVVSKDQENIVSTDSALMVVSKNIKITLFDRITKLDLEINELLEKISKLSQEKTKLLRNFVDQGSLLD